MKEKKILLISGIATKNSYREETLKNTVFDREREKEVERAYCINNEMITPRSAFYYSKEGKKKVLREDLFRLQPLVTRTLESILEDADLTFDSIECNCIWKEIEWKGTYEIVCLSTTFMWTQNMLKNAIDWINRNIEYGKLILGGHYSSVNYSTILQNYPDVDYIIIGDGEKALPELIHAVVSNQKSDVIDIPNLAFIRNDTLYKSELEYEDINKISRIRYNGKMLRIPYETVRGCVYNCAFCTWNSGIRHFRYKGVDKILQDIKEYVQENEVERIDFNDSTLFYPFDRIEPLLDGLIKLNVHWKANARADSPFTEKTREKLEKSKCDILEFGFESMNDRILKNMMKGTTSKRNRYINTLFRDSPINTVMSFIIGFPDESVDEFYSTTGEYLLKEHFGHFYIFVYEMEDKNTAPWKNRERYGLELLEDQEDCIHEGLNWVHNGMNSKEAFAARNHLLKQLRKEKSLAIYRSWQSWFQWPLIPEYSKRENLIVERLLDNLIFAPQDVDEDHFTHYVCSLRDELVKHGIYFETVE